MSLPAIIRGEVSPPVTLINELCDAREHVLAQYRQMIDSNVAIRETEIPGLPQAMGRGYAFTPGDESFRRITKTVDAAIWLHAIDRCGFSCLMNAGDLQQLRDQISHDCPPVTRDTMAATLVEQYRGARATFVAGLIQLFRDLDSKYASHDGWKIGRRLVFHGLGANSWHTYSCRDRFNDLSRCLMLLDGKNPAAEGHKDQPARLIAAAKRVGAAHFATDYLDCRLFKNGNVHAWFRRQDLVDKANDLIAEHYGMALGGAA